MGREGGRSSFGSGDGTLTCAAPGRAREGAMWASGAPVRRGAPRAPLFASSRRESLSGAVFGVRCRGFGQSIIKRLRQLRFERNRHALGTEMRTCG